ncbi:PREDICTED: phospholipase A2, membrane associated-like [Tauraco erythrolophus]|uniref:phospholipase A2, membrane associated-like n=1 Tax=Tauraco erythrolophus TaxID=121530 RepID=UPI000523A999|nr:PREDICTED: phospholipase A2, membrane associated-like [Tauraco erythrolophus]
MKNLLFAVLLACGLLPARGSVLELEQMIKSTTGKSALLSYSWYGCFCGIGGRGTPVDSTDQGCHAHDCIWGAPRGPHRQWQLEKTPQNTVFLPPGNEQSWCKRETCLCDKAVASCFARALDSYNKSYRFYFKLKCRGNKLQC